MMRNWKILPASLLVLSFGAEAAVTLTMTQNSSGVIVEGKGSVNTFNGLTAIDFSNYSAGTVAVAASQGNIVAANVLLHVWEMNATAQIIGSGLPVTASNASFNGQGFALTANANFIGLTNTIALPVDYSAGDLIDFQLTFENATLDSLGFYVGSYTWTWGTGQDSDSVTLHVIPAVSPPTATTSVPGLNTFGLIGLAGLMGAAASAMHRKRQRRSNKPLAT